MESLGESLGGPSPTLWDSMEAEAARISQEYGLDANRVRKVAEALLLHNNTDDPRAMVIGEDGTNIEFHLGELREAIEQMGPDRALDHFESDDIEAIERRYRMFQYLKGERQPLYSLKELGVLAHSTRESLKAGMQVLCRRGRCALDDSASGLVFSPLCNLLFPNPLLTEEARSDPDEGTTEKELVRLREELYPIQERILDLISDSCRDDRPARELRVMVIEHLDSTISDKTIRRVLELEGGEDVLPPTDEALDYEVEYPYGGRFLGGLRTILQVLCHIEIELELRVYDVAFSRLRGFVDHGPSSGLRKMRGEYFHLLARPEGKRLNDALDEFSSNLSKANAYRQEFRRAYSLALLEEHPVELLGVRVPSRIQTTIRSEMHRCAQFLVDFYINSGMLPKKLQLIPEGMETPPTDRRMVFDGSDWVIEYEGIRITPKDMIGFHYIRCILRKHPNRAKLAEVAASVDERSRFARRNPSISGDTPNARHESTEDLANGGRSLHHFTSEADEGSADYSSTGCSSIHEKEGFQILDSPDGSHASEHETDERALSVVRKRMTQLEAELRTVEDSHRRSEIQQELKDIDDYMKSTSFEARSGHLEPKKIKGRSIELQRVAIRNAVNRAIMEIRRRNSPRLADDLKAITIGTECYYKAAFDRCWNT
jgi:hypothetical protein